MHHILRFHGFDSAEQAGQILLTLNIPVQTLRIEQIHTLHFSTPNALDEATQDLILEKCGPLSSSFNVEDTESTGPLGFDKEKAIADYTHACANLSVSSTETSVLSVRSSKTIERLEAEAAEIGLQFKFDEDNEVWTLVPLEVVDQDAGFTSVKIRIWHQERKTKDITEYSVITANGGDKTASLIIAWDAAKNEVKCDVWTPPDMDYTVHDSCNHSEDYCCLEDPESPEYQDATLLQMYDMALKSLEAQVKQAKIADGLRADKARVDTSPMVTPTRRKRRVLIQEMNEPPSHLFDTTKEYDSDDLPEWFKGLQSIVEDETFTSMAINIGKGKVFYRIALVKSEK